MWLAAAERAPATACELIRQRGLSQSLSHAASVQREKRGIEVNTWFKMARDNKRTEEDDIPHERKGTRPDFSIPPPRKQLPKELQDTLNNEEKLWEVLYEGKYVHMTLFTVSPVSYKC